MQKGNKSKCPLFFLNSPTNFAQKTQRQKKKMAPKIFERCIHSEGHTVISYSPDGRSALSLLLPLLSFSLSSFFSPSRRIVTGGSDAFVRVFDAHDDPKDPATLKHCNDNINSVTVTVKPSSFQTSFSPFDCVFAPGSPYCRGHRRPLCPHVQLQDPSV